MGRIFQILVLIFSVHTVSLARASNPSDAREPCEEYVLSEISPIGLRILRKVDQLNSLRETAPEKIPKRVQEFLQGFRASYKSRLGRLVEVKQAPLLIQGMAAPKGDFLEITVVRIALWNADKNSFYLDGEIPHTSGLKTGTLFLDFAIAILMWAHELKSEWPETKWLRIDAMDLRNAELDQLIQALGFKPWPANPKNQRLLLPLK
jgi:hypothetical protein